MNKETLKALKGSIEKWEAIVAGTGVDSGTINCPLCKFFCAPTHCSNCPTNCTDNTPFRKWDNHHKYHSDKLAKYIHCPTCKKLAQAELEHLKSLLPG